MKIFNISSRLGAAFALLAVPMISVVVALEEQEPEGRDLQQERVEICHKRGKNGFSPLTVAESAVWGHMTHGDVPAGGWYPDTDGDGFGDESAAPETCPPDDSYVQDNTDCDDSDSDVNPDGTEDLDDDGDSCLDGKDNDCDGDIDEDDSDCFCFSKDTIVDVKGKGRIPIDQLQLGDMVLTSQGFSPVFAFGTRRTDKMVDFVKLTTESAVSIEVSSNHLVLVGVRQEPKFAAEIMIGDMLTILPDEELSQVVSVARVSKQGAFHPLTRDGTIIASGVLASVHAPDPFAPSIKIAGVTIMNTQDFQNLLFTPLRLICRISPETLCGDSASWKDDGSHILYGILEDIQTLLLAEYKVQTVMDTDGGYGMEVNFLTWSKMLPVKFGFLLFLLVAMVLDFFLRNLFVIASLTVVMIFQASRLKKRKVAA